MNIRDIVNRDIVNLTNCEHEPIHIPGSIQPHGFIIAIKEADYIIDFCSKNIIDFTGINYEAALGKKWKDVFGEDHQQQISNYIDALGTSLPAPSVIEFNSKPFTYFIHKSNNVYIAEFEPTAELPGINTVYNQSIEFITGMEKAATLQQLCQQVAEQTKKITGYDRVMIYRFDKDYNGEVFAESKEEYLESFFGLHYPHTDIPAQARELYIRNLVRIIVDVNYTPVPIYTVDDAPGKNLDLGMASLRSVSPIHVQYLNNMGVGATLTVSLMHENKLWGLIACHHYSKKYLTPHTRIAAQLQGQLLTSQIKVRQVAEEYKLAQEVNESLEALLNEPFEISRECFKHIISNPLILSLCNAGGAAIVFDNTVYKIGNTPANEDIHQLAVWLKTISRQGIYSTAKLADSYNAGKKLCSSAAGVIYHSLGGINHDCIIWFRPETLEEVHWAGDPEKAIVKDEKGLSPRQSFEKWKQVIQCQAKEWQTPELSVASRFAHTLQAHVHMVFLSEEEARYRQLTEQLKDANAELENINWISTHDLREPLRKIQIFSSMLLDKEQEQMSEAVITSIQKMNNSAHRMQKLLNDITSYARIRNNHDIYEDVDLAVLLAEVTNEVKEEAEDKNGVINYHSLPAVKGIPLLLHQLFINLIRNALKFTKPGVAPMVTISGYNEAVALPDAKDGDQTLYNKIAISDNGIGFSNQFSESIFKVFTRLHNQAEYAGSGVGLALCRKIMQNHNGFIYADGNIGEGATFTLYFPATTA